MGKYFTIAEMVRSGDADRHGINNRCNKEQANNLMKLIDNVLDPLREAYGKPIIVTSGFRCVALNNLEKGAKNSHHLRGMAADIKAIEPKDNAKLFYLVQELGLPYTQLIWEKGNNHNPAWVHVSYDENDLRMEILRL